jgi:hypothetical protein
MALRTTVLVAIAVAAFATNPAISLGSYCGPDGCPPFRVQVGAPGMPMTGPAMAGPRPMAAMQGCAPACPPPCPPMKCPPPCPPPACGPPACPPPSCKPPCEGFNPLSAIFNLVTLPFRLFSGGAGQGCEPPCAPPACMPMMASPCPPPIAKCKPEKGYGYAPAAPMRAMRPMGY